MTRLKELRKSIGLSQKDFGDLFHASQNAVSQWENGVREMNYATTKAIAQYFNVSVDYLLGNDAPSEATLPPPPSEIGNAIAALADGLSQEELQRVMDFIAGMKAARKG